MNEQKFCPERFITIRSVLSLSASEAARRIDISVAQYLEYESGDMVPSADMIISFFLSFKEGGAKTPALLNLIMNSPLFSVSASFPSSFL